MRFANDVYVIAAADIVPLWAGRCYNLALGRWESVHGVNPTPSSMPQELGKPWLIKSVNMTVHLTTGSLKAGVWGMVFAVGDPVRTGDVVPILQVVQGRAQQQYFLGSQELLAGVQWRIHKGGLIAGDYVEMSVGYDR
jgi:hypothetical protein